MATLYVQSPTLYQASSGNIVGATSVTLTSLTDIYGNVLTMADFGSLGYITLEPDTTNSEGATFTGVTANANGTYTLTGVKTILAKSPYTQTSGLIRQHSGGTKVVVTDNVSFWDTFVNKNNDSTILGKVTLTSTQPMIYDVEPTLTDPKEVATKAYADALALASAVPATPSAIGYVKLSAVSATPTLPVVVETADTRMPTQGENDALAGTSGTPSSTNKFITDADSSTTLSGTKTIRANAGAYPAGDGAAITNVPTGKITTAIPIVTVGTSSTAENTLLSYSLAGGLLGTSNVIRVSGYITCANAGTISTCTFRFKYGATTLFTTTHDLSGGLANYTYLFNFTIYANGATNIQTSDLGMMNNHASVADVIGANTATEDSTASKNIIITAQNSISDVDFAATLRNVVIKKIS